MPKITLVKQVLFGRIQRSLWLCLFFAAFVLANTLLSVPRTSEAATSSTINFQARLLQSSGAIVPDGYYNAEFKLYNVSSGGTAEWTETYYDSNGVTAGSDARVRVANGYLTVNLGSLTTFGGGIDWSEEHWLTMNIGGVTQTATPTWDGEMSPRLKLTAVPYAFEAGNAGMLEGLTADQFAQLTANQTFTGRNIFSGSGNGTSTYGALFKNTTDSATAFSIQDSDGTTLLGADTTHKAVGISMNPTTTGGTLQVNGAMTLSGTGQTLFTTPGSTDVYTKINIPLYDPGLYGQVLALGLPDDADSTSRVISLFDARTSAHQPSLALFSPDETKAFGFSWEGSNSNGYLKTTSGNIGIRSGTTDIAMFNSSGSTDFFGDTTVKTASNSTTAFRLQSASAANTLLTGDTSNNRLKVGDADNTSGANTTLLVLDSASTANLPTGVNGGMVYDSQLGKFKIYENGAYKILCNQTDSASCGGGVTSLQGATGALTIANATHSSGTITIDDATVSTKGIASFNTSDFSVTSGAVSVGTNIAKLNADQTFSGTNTFTGSGNGSSTYGMLVKNTTNSATAFAIQDQGSKNYILVDTSGASISVGNTGIASTIQVGNTTGAVTQTINVGNNATASSITTLNIGSAISTSATTIESGSGTLAIGNGATAHTIQIGTGAAVQGVTVGSTNSTSTITLQGGNSSAAVSIQSAASGTVGIANSGVANTLQLGNSTGNVTQTINVGNNTTGTSNINIGNSAAGTVAVTGPTTITNRTSGSSDTFVVSNSTSTGTIATFKDNTTAVFSLADGGAALLQNSTDSTTAFQIQNAGGTSTLLNVDTTTSNLITNPSMEVDTTGWATTGSGTGLAISRTITTANVYHGRGALQVVTASSAANSGASVNTFTSAITPAQYTLSFIARATVSFSTFNVTITGGSAPSCLTGQTVGTGFQRYTCTFTSTSTNVTAINFITTDSTQRTIYIDAVQLLSGSNSTPYTPGKVQLNGVVSSPTVFQNSSDSTVAFQIQNASGGSLFNIDTTNSNITLNGSNSGIVQDWQTGNSSGMSGRAYPATIIANGYMYMIGGVSGGTAQSAVQYAKLNANGNVGNWTTTTALPVNLADPAVAVANGYIYVTGGSTGNSYATAVDTVYYAKVNFDGTISSWRTGTAINVSGSQKRWDHTSIAYNGYLYVLGGTDNTNASSAAVYVSKLSSDGSNGTWSSVNNFSAAGSAAQNASIGIANGYMYLIGGSGTTATRYVRINADGTLGTWANTTVLPQDRTGAGIAIMNGYVYIIGGNNNGSTYYAGSYFAPLNSDGTIGTWNCQGAAGDCSGTTPVNSVALPATRAGFSNAPLMSNGYLYVPSGTNASIGATFYYASTARVQINGSLDLVGASGENLSEGGSGGTLTAGDTNIVGQLTVRSMANFGQSVAVGDSLIVGGSAVVRNASNAATAFQVQNSSGVSNFKVSTVNLVGNASFETGVVNVDTAVDGWTKKLGSETSLKVQASNAQFGSNAMELVTTTTAQQGAKYPVSLAASTQYTLSFYAKVSTSSFSTLTFGRTDTGASAGETSCVTTGALTTTYTRYSCNFTTGATMGANGTPYVYISKGTDTTARTLYIDGVQLETGASATTYRESDINLDGQVTFKNSANSTTAFQIQNASGSNILTADSTNSRLLIGAATTPTLTGAELAVTLAEVQTTLRVGGSTNGLSFNDAATGASGKLRLYGTARNTKKLVLTPEFAGAVLDGSGTGTMTAGYDSTQRENYYKWTTTQVTSQAYDVVVTMSVPSDWSAWAASNALTVDSWSSNLTNSTGTVTVISTNNTTDVNAASITPGSTSTWTTTNANLTSSSIYVADGVMIVKLHMTANNSSTFQLGNVTLTYLSQF